MRGLRGPAKPQAHDTANDQGDPEELSPVQPLAKKQGAQNDNSYTRHRGPYGVPHADIEGKHRETEKVSGDGAGNKGAGGLANSGESSRFAGRDRHQNFEDYGHTQIKPMHDEVL